MSRAMLAKVHIAKKQLGLDDDTYRLLLERVTGQATAKGLDERQLDAVLSEMRKLGFEPTKRGGKTLSDRAEVRKIWALWGELCRTPGAVRNPGRPALRAFVERMTGRSDPEWMTVDETRKVIEALKSWIARERRKACK